MRNTKTTTYGELKNGDKVILEGTVFEVAYLRRFDLSPGRTAVRFAGFVVDKNDALYNTGFNGGTYGGYLDDRCTKIDG